MDAKEGCFSPLHSDGTLPSLAPDATSHFACPENSSCSFDSKPLPGDSQEFSESYDGGSRVWNGAEVGVPGRGGEEWSWSSTTAVKKQSPLRSNKNKASRYEIMLQRHPINSKKALRQWSAEAAKAASLGKDSKELVGGEFFFFEPDECNKKKMF